jgi:hypothetical protein
MYCHKRLDSQPSGRGPVPGPDVTYAGPSSCRKKNLPGRGLTKVENHWARESLQPSSLSVAHHMYGLGTRIVSPDESNQDFR